MRKARLSIRAAGRRAPATPASNAIFGFVGVNGDLSVLISLLMSLESWLEIQWH